MAILMRKNPFRLNTDPFDSVRFVTSWCLSPVILAAIRTAIAVYSFFVIFYIMGYEGTNQGGLSIHDVRKSFSFFTILCYWGSSFYFAVSATHTVTYLLTGRPLLDRFPRILQALHHFFWTTIVTFPFLVTIVYWGVLFAGFDNEFQLWSNVSQHAMNSVFGLFELVFTRINPAPWIYLFFLILLLCGYLGVAYLTLATKHYYVYPFLDPSPQHLNAAGAQVGGVGSHGLVAAYVVGIAAAICILFAISKGVQNRRKWLTEEKLGMRGNLLGGHYVEDRGIEFDEHLASTTKEEDSKV